MISELVASTSIMFLTFITTFVVFMKTTTDGATTEFPPWSERTYTTTNSSQTDCPFFGAIENGYVRIIDDAANKVAVIKCNEGYDLDGAPNVYCIDGKWEELPRPQCSKRCYPPPYIKNGSLEIEGEKDEKGLFHKGTLATYSCGDGFNLMPKESKYRVCEKGIWTGAYAICESVQKITNCPAPKDITNGYFVHEKTGEFDGYRVGQRLHHSCKSGYVLVGTPVQQCLEDGTWSPKLPPVCSLAIAGRFLL